MSATLLWLPIWVLAQTKGGAVDPSAVAKTTGGSPWLVPMIIFALSVAALIGWLIKRHYDAKLEPGYANDEELFTELCQAHSLDAPKIALLRELVAYHELTEPARLFVEQGRFTEDLSPELNAKIDELAKLREQLFSVGA